MADMKENNMNDGVPSLDETAAEAVRLSVGPRPGAGPEKPRKDRRRIIIGAAAVAVAVLVAGGVCAHRAYESHPGVGGARRMRIGRGGPGQSHESVQDTARLGCHRGRVEDGREEREGREDRRHAQEGRRCEASCHGQVRRVQGRRPGRGRPRRRTRRPGPSSRIRRRWRRRPRRSNRRCWTRRSRTRTRCTR